MELVDCGQVDGAESLNPALELLERLVPDGGRGVGGQARCDFLEHEAGPSELFGDGLGSDLRLANREADVVGELADLVDRLLAFIALLLGFPQLRVDVIHRLARLAEIGLDDQTLVELRDECLLICAQRLRRGADLAVQLLSSFRQVSKLALHSKQRRACRLLRATPRLHLDCDRLRLFSVLLGGSTRSGDAVLMLTPLLVELFARRRQGALAAHRSTALRPALLDRADQGLLLCGQLRDRAVECPGSLPRLIELCAIGTELGLGVREQILATRGLGLSLRTSFLQPLELEASVGLRFRDLVGPARCGVRALAQALDLVAAGNDADLRIVAAVHAQPVAADPDSFTRYERLAIGEVAAPRDRILYGLRNAHADQERCDGCRRLHMPEQRRAIRRCGRARHRSRSASGRLPSDPSANRQSHRCS